MLFKYLIIIYTKVHTHYLSVFCSMICHLVTVNDLQCETCEHPQPLSINLHTGKYFSHTTTQRSTYPSGQNAVCAQPY